MKAPGFNGKVQSSVRILITSYCAHNFQQLVLTLVTSCAGFQLSILFLCPRLKKATICLTLNLYRTMLHGSQRMDISCLKFLLKEMYSHAFINAMIYSCQYRLMDVYFLFRIIIQYYYISLLILFQFGLWVSLSVHTQSPLVCFLNKNQ